MPTPKSGWRIEDLPENKRKLGYIEDAIVINYFRRKDILAQRPAKVQIVKPIDTGLLVLFPSTGKKVRMTANEFVRKVCEGTFDYIENDSHAEDINETVVVEKSLATVSGLAGSVLAV